MKHHNLFFNRVKQSVFLLVGLFFCTSLWAQEAFVEGAEVPPVVDGKIDAVWEDAEAFDLVLPYTGEEPTVGEPGETYWKMLHCDSGLFVLVVVTDDVFAPACLKPDSVAGGASYRYDGVEIYFDNNLAKADGVGGGSGKGHDTMQPKPAADGSGVAYTINSKSGKPYTYAYYWGDMPNWSIEYFIPFSSLLNRDGEMVDRFADIGFDIYIIDSDVYPPVRHRMCWSNVGAINENYRNMDDAGLVFLDGIEDLNYTASIILEDKTIDVDNGTIDMAPLIIGEDPDAPVTVIDLEWNLIPGTGKATMDNGKVTGILNGTVQVMAKALDGSWVESDTVTVTIVNQKESMDDWSYLTNGTFTDTTKAGKPAEWGMRKDNKISVVDGVVQINNTSRTAIWDGRINYTMDIPYQMQIDSTFVIYFQAWSERHEMDTLVVNVEDLKPGRSNLRYGTTTDPESENVTLDGSVEDGSSYQSCWEILLTDEPTKYELTVSFPNAVEGSIPMLGICGGHLDPETTVYIDSVYFIPQGVTSFEADEETSRIQATNIEDFVSLYPNPVADVLTVNVMNELSIVEVYNIAGKMMLQHTMQGVTDQVDVSQLNAGIYFLRTNEGACTKFVKK